VGTGIASQATGNEAIAGIGGAVTGITTQAVNGNVDPSNMVGAVTNLGG